MRYELLNEGEVIKEGDQYFNVDGGWFCQKCLTGETIKSQSQVFRRPLPDKPKVRLEELAEIIYKAWHESESHCLFKIAEEIAEDVCDYLNIELEEPKPEWEVEFDNLLGEAGKGKDIPHIKEWCKKMFEAGQKSKEGK